MTRDGVVAITRSWLLTPHQHGQSLKGIAADCGGLIRGVGVEAGLIPADFKSNPQVRPFMGYGRQPAGGMMEAACALFLDPIPVREAGLADVLLMRWDGDPQHLGIISSTDPLRIIHTFATARKVAENGIAGEWRHGITWRSLIVSAWRFRGIDD